MMKSLRTMSASPACLSILLLVVGCMEPGAPEGSPCTTGGDCADGSCLFDPSWGNCGMCASDTGNYETSAEGAYRTDTAQLFGVPICGGSGEDNGFTEARLPSGVEWWFSNCFYQFTDGSSTNLGGDRSFSFLPSVDVPLSSRIYFDLLGAGTLHLGWSHDEQGHPVSADSTDASYDVSLTVGGYTGDVETYPLLGTRFNDMSAGAVLSAPVTSDGRLVEFQGNASCPMHDDVIGTLDIAGEDGTSITGSFSATVYGSRHTDTPYSCGLDTMSRTYQICSISGRFTFNREDVYLTDWTDLRLGGL